MNGNGPKKVRFQTVGCRLNQYETEKMAADLVPYGLVRAKKNEPADLYIINTCTVTHRADKDSRYFVRRAKRENPDARVVLVGCYVETDPEAVAHMDGVDAVIRNHEKDLIADILPPKMPEIFNLEPSAACGSDLVDFYKRNRAWIKVSDGCNQNCSYCLVTIVRGELRPRPAAEIIDEVNHLVEHGYREIVFTGVNMGYYNDDVVTPPIKSFAGLCRKILDETDLYRLRLSSIEPQTVTDELLKVYREAEGRICRHWHIPMQSGSSRILKLMRRPYTREIYLDKLAVVKEALPGAVIGADVIVGFPGETEDDFRDNCSAAESGLIDYLHVFSYSDRPGTPAAEMPDKVRPEVIRERVAVLKEISARRLQEARDREVGNILEVISEHKGTPGGDFLAVSDNYLRVKLSGSVAGGKNIVRVKVTAVRDDYLEGDVIA